MWENQQSHESHEIESRKLSKFDSDRLYSKIARFYDIGLWLFGYKLAVHYFIGDVTKPLPLQHKQFDLIITGGVLEYVNPEVAVKNLGVYLKRGGYFLNSPVKDNLLGRIIAKLYRFKPRSRTTYINAFINNGFIFKRMRSFPIIKEAHLFQKINL